MGREEGTAHCGSSGTEEGSAGRGLHTDNNYNNVFFQDTEVDTAIVARDEVSATDADLDIIYYELTTTVQVSISGDKE